MKLLTSFATRIEADVCKAALEANGIRSFVTADDAGAVYPTRTFAMGGAKVFVKESDVEKAKEVLDKLER